MIIFPNQIIFELWINDIPNKQIKKSCTKLMYLYDQWVWFVCESVQGSQDAARAVTSSHSLCAC